MTREQPADPLALLRVLRERHPDVDVVVLPQRDADLPPAPTGRARDLVERARTALTHLHAGLRREPTARVELWWRQDQPDVHRLVERQSFGDLPPGDAVQLLRDLGDDLLAQGWTAGPMDDAVPALLAVSGDGDLGLTARAVGPAVDVELVSAPLRLDRAELPELERAR